MDRLICIGKNIRARRKALRWTQGMLGKAIGMGPSSISRIERGKQNMKVHELASIAKALSVTEAAIYQEYGE